MTTEQASMECTQHRSLYHTVVEHTAVGISFGQRAPHESHSRTIASNVDSRQGT